MSSRGRLWPRTGCSTLAEGPRARGVCVCVACRGNVECAPSCMYSPPCEPHRTSSAYPAIRLVPVSVGAMQCGCEGGCGWISYRTDAHRSVETEEALTELPHWASLTSRVLTLAPLCCLALGNFACRCLNLLSRISPLFFRGWDLIGLNLNWKCRRLCWLCVS